MRRHIDTLGRAVRRTAALGLPLLVAASGAAAAHGGGGYGGMMGGGGGFVGGTMGLWGLLWLGLLLAVPLALGYSLLGRRSDGTDDRALSVLRERYAHGELSDDEFERRREQLERI